MSLFTFSVAIALINKIDWMKILHEYKVFLSLLPCFYITRFGFKYLNIKIRTISNIFILGVSFLTLVGVATYFFPSITDFLPSDLTSGESVLLMTDTTRVLLGEKTLIRGGGSLWGSLSIAAYFTLFFYLFYIKGSNSFKKQEKMFYFGTCLLLAINMVLSGHRSVWIGIFLGTAVYANIKGAKTTFRVAIALLAISFFIPEEVYLRLISVGDPSAWAGRDERYKAALDQIMHNPLIGGGWGASGWVHNFVLQLGANLGIVGLSAFLLWLGKIYFSAVRVYKRSLDDELLRPYCLGFIVGWATFMGPMLGQSVITLPNLMIPFWFFCAVLHNFSSGFIFEKSANGNDRKP